MKKLHKKLKTHYESNLSKIERLSFAKSKLTKARRRRKEIKSRREKADRRRNPGKYVQIDLRRDLKEKIYRPTKPKDEEITVEIDKEFGFESENGRQYFLDKAASFIEISPKKLVFDISKCDRFWPTGVTLLCSLKQWLELTSKKPFFRTIGNGDSDFSEVNDYLSYCGFNAYVNNQKEEISNVHFDAKHVVKIKREKNREEIEKREDEIASLIEAYSVMTKEEVAYFVDSVVIESFTNVTEHGVTSRDNGWWVLAQYHPTHKLISLCIADNGIGVRNSLMTGPQRERIEADISNTPQNDGDFLNLALDEYVSGAEDAEIKVEKRRFWEKGHYDRGSSRGNGLKRIRQCCKKLDIKFSVLSHNGYAFMDSNGEREESGSKTSKVFAGTMLHYVIPAK